MTQQTGRSYEQTHPWIAFQLDLKNAPVQFWINLGEIRSKCEHIAGIPLDKETGDQLYRLYLARGVQATTAIEGNTLTEAQVGQRIEGKLELPDSSAYLGQEVDNILAACNSILARLVQDKPPELTPDFVKELNRLVLDKLPLEANVVPGEIRTFSVAVGSYRGAPAGDCEYLLNRLCSWLGNEASQNQDLDQISTAVIRAILAHLYLAWIHPFGDGNGRTARLVEFLILLGAGFPAPAAHLLSNHYNQTRTSYYQELANASNRGGDVLSFLMYATTGLLDGLKEQISKIQNFQLSLIWRDFVSETLRSKATRLSAAVRARLRDLIHALSEQNESVPRKKITLLTPLLAQTYAQKTQKTVTRDLNILKQLGLIEISNGEVRAKVETILAFQSPRKKVTDE